MMNHPWSAIHLTNAAELDRLYKIYVEDRSKCDPSLALFFDGLTFAKQDPEEGQGSGIPGSFFCAYLLDRYLQFAHFYADVNPLEPKAIATPILPFIQEISNYDQSQKISLGSPWNKEICLGDLITLFNQTFCKKIGFEMAHVKTEARKWLLEKIATYPSFSFSDSEKQEVLSQLVSTREFETFLHRTFQGKKRFSIEGAEMMIPMLKKLACLALEKDVVDFAIGMAHRGRLNTLTHVLQKPYSMIFCEFDESYIPITRAESGDVKYHLGFSSDLKEGDKNLHMHLLYNPSHLEAIDPVLKGFARAKGQVRMDMKKVLPVLIHGDAAFAGQGIVYETLQMTHLEGYTTEGIIHIIVNNQIGFTASSKEGRSTDYTTDLAKTFGMPVFHLNGEDPESVLFATKLAFEYRQTFGSSVLLDLHCYRKYGHNESDEPGFTQPKMWELIQSKDSIDHLFAVQYQLEDLYLEYQAKVRATLEENLSQSQTFIAEGPKIAKVTEDQLSSRAKENGPLSVEIEKLQSLCKDLSTPPDGFTVHPKLQKILTSRLEILQKPANEALVDFALAETLSYATILTQGTPIRISGQDARRGTFSHRHAVYVDPVTEKKWIPLEALAKEKTFFEIHNSFLSEEAVMGFEYGFTLGFSKAFVIWEAQFGDFANGAQVVIDQFLASGEAKWGRQSSLTLFLPHGQEGQGPEHSSARMERFLSLCASNNMKVVQTTTAAQTYHILRLQAKSSVKKPLILFTHKSLLREKRAQSSMQELSLGTFLEIIPDASNAFKATRVLLCSGKIYYQLQEEQKKHPETAILRIEQLYPFPGKSLMEQLALYRSVKEVVYVQEEPANQGALNYIRLQIKPFLGEKVRFFAVARPEMAAPATGYPKIFKQEQEKLILDAFTGKGDST